MNSGPSASLAPDVPSIYAIISQRIKMHRALYRQNEMAVRTQLVEPILREIGWNLEEPDQAVPNFSEDKGLSNYVLFTHEKPTLFVGVEQNLEFEGDGENEIAQLLNHAAGEGLAYGVLTTGAVWILAASFKIGTKSIGRVIWKVDLENHAQQSPGGKFNMLTPQAIANLGSVIQKAEFLGRAWATLISDPTYFVLGLAPTVKELLRASHPDVEFSPEEIEDYVVSKVEQLLAVPSVTAAADLALKPLEDFKTQVPGMLLFGEEYDIHHAYDILLNTANWLVKQGKLAKEDAPINAGPKRYLVSTEPLHVRGNAFLNPRQIANGLWLEVHYSRSGCIRYARNLLKRYKYDPTKLIVQ